VPRKESSPLVAAATALDAELGGLADLARAASQESLDTERSMARATKTLTTSVEQQSFIEQRLRALVAEIERVRERQQESTQSLLDFAHEVERRGKSRDALHARFAALAESAAHVNTLAAALGERKAAGAPDAEVLERLAAIQVELAGVVGEAEVLVDAATRETWPEIARQADTVRQQMLAAKNKLALAQRTLASRAPS
jgi:chromosome segregation ATPase